MKSRGCSKWLWKQVLPTCARWLPRGFRPRVSSWDDTHSRAEPIFPGTFRSLFPPSDGLWGRQGWGWGPATGRVEGRAHVSVWDPSTTQDTPVGGQREGVLFRPRLSPPQRHTRPDFVTGAHQHLLQAPSWGPMGRPLRVRPAPRQSIALVLLNRGLQCGWSVRLSLLLGTVPQTSSSPRGFVLVSAVRPALCRSGHMHCVVWRRLATWGNASGRLGPQASQRE